MRVLLATGDGGLPGWVWLVGIALVVGLAFVVLAIRGYPKDGAF